MKIGRVYSGGWVKLIDECSTERFGMLRLCNIAGALGVKGMSNFWFRKPRTSLQHGLVRLKTDNDIKDMMEWVPSVRNLDVYVTHPIWKVAKEEFLYDLYLTWREMWPELDDEVDDEYIVDVPNGENQRDVVCEKIEQSKKNVVPELDDDHVVEVPENVEEQLRNMGTEKIKGQAKENYFLEWYSMKEVPEKIAKHRITLENGSEDAQTQNESITSDPVNPFEHCVVFNDPNDICNMTLDDFEGEGPSVGNQAWMDDILQDQSSDADTMHMNETINGNESDRNGDDENETPEPNCPREFCYQDQENAEEILGYQQTQTY